jgi:hypothetical protein
MIKAVEIDRGEWTPVRSHAIGWSILLAPVLATVRNLPALTLMNITRAAASLVGALVVVPFAFLVRETLDRRGQVLALLLCPFALLLVRISVRGFAEPALTFVLVGAVAAAAMAHRRTDAWIVAAILAGTGFWFHPTGLLNIGIAAAIVFVTAARAERLRLAAAVVVLAAAVSVPAGLQRERAFGSALDFSFNNRFFAATDLEMYTPRATPPTLRQYFSTHTAGQIADRFLVRGLGAELKTFSFDVLHGLLVPLVIVGCWLVRRDPLLRPHVIALTVFLTSWIPVYELYGNGRHLSVGLPFALALAAAAVVYVTRNVRHAGAWALAAAMTFGVAESTAAVVQRQRAVHDSSLAGLEWGRWTAEHVRGRLAISGGHELVMMFLPDASVGGADIFSMYAPTTGLALIRPGEFPTLDEAMTWMRAQHVTHLVVDPQDEGTPYLAPLASGPPPPYLIEEYTSPRDSQWPVRIFRFRWDRYDKA